MGNGVGVGSVVGVDAAAASKVGWLTAGVAVDVPPQARVTRQATMHALSVAGHRFRDIPMVRLLKVWSPVSLRAGPALGQDRLKRRHIQGRRRVAHRIHRHLRQLERGPGR